LAHAERGGFRRDLAQMLELCRRDIDRSIERHEVTPDGVDACRDAVIQRQRDADRIGVVCSRVDHATASAIASRTALPVACAAPSPSAAATGPRNGRGGRCTVPSS